jgi:hypothetical protein
MPYKGNGMKRSRKISFGMIRILNHLAAIAVALTFSSQVLAKDAAADNQKVFDYSSDPEVVILSYSVRSEMLANADLTPRIRVFGDGYVRVHYPAYMTKAGDYETWLNPGEMNQLLLAMSGVFDFDPKAVKNSRKMIKEAREQQTGRLQHHSDDTVEQIEVVLDSYQENAKSAGSKINLKLLWKNIAIDASEYPELVSLQKLNGARNSIHALLLRNDLARIGGEQIND